MALAFFTEVGRVAVESQCVRVLSDLREAKIVASTSDIYRMAQSLGNTQITKAFKRAIVVCRDDGDSAFWETVCFNQGFHNVKIFRDNEKAQQWISPGIDGA